MGEVYSIGIDLSQLQKALQMSLQIKNNLGPLGSGGGSQSGSNNSQVQKSSNSFSNSIQQQNKGLKEQNKLLGGSLQKLNLIRLVSSKIKWGALAGAGLAMGGITAGIAAMNGSLSTNTRAKNIGLGFGESNALNFAGKMTGLGEDTLISSIEGLTTSLQDYSKWGNFASLGLNASDLQNKNPTEALFEVLESMKNSDLPQYMKKEIIDNIGIPFDQFKFVLSEGTGEIQKYFKEGMGMFGGKSGKALMEGERALIRFTTILKDVSQNIGGKIAPALTTGLKLITPYIYQLADGFTWLLGKVFTKKNLDMMSGFFNSIGKIGSDLVSKGVDLFNGGKDLFSQMFKGFSIDTEGWTNVFKELSKGFLDGMSSLWDTLKPNLISIGQSLVEVWKTIEPDLMSFIKWFQKDILPSVMSIGGTYINVLSKTIKRLADDFKSFWNFMKPVLKPLGNAIKGFAQVMSEIWKQLDEWEIDELIADLVSPISKLQTVFEAVSGLKEWWDNFQLSGDGIWDYLKESFSNIWLDITKGLNDIWEMIKRPFLIMITGLVDGVNAAIKAMQFWEKDKSKLSDTIRWGYGYNPQGKFGKRVYNSQGQYNIMPEQKVNDAIITKAGQVVKTDPQDYILAMKHPQELASSGTVGANHTYTININANIRNDNDIKKLKNELERLIKSFNSKR
ncbi:hypothetical protein R4J03_09010 [Brachyspira intermedia]|uniref:hypothetical protein n=1 Tax=Brachyspira intermedia TaxID=84377 RepID=UPI003007C889